MVKIENSSETRGVKLFVLPSNEMESIIESAIESKLRECLTNPLIFSDSKNTEDSDEFLNAKEAARFLNVRIPTIYSKVSKSEIPVMKRGNKLFFSKKELIDYLKAGRKKTVQELEGEAEEYLKEKGGKKW
ncbi:MAG: helix-turn-helix domain-containing protein [Bacteroidota bacterium]